MDGDLLGEPSAAAQFRAAKANGMDGGGNTVRDSAVPDTFLYADSAEELERFLGLHWGGFCLPRTRFGSLCQSNCNRPGG